jgi:hypothetical protein
MIGYKSFNALYNAYYAIIVFVMLFDPAFFYISFTFIFAPI